VLYKCRGCNAPPRAEQWRRRCPSCFGYWDCVKVGNSDANRVTAASLTSIAPVARIPTSIASLDNSVLGGGLVPGVVYLLAAGKGTGKSSLAMAIADGVARGSRKALYASGEEAAVRVGEIARRMRIANEQIAIMGDACDIDDIIDRCDQIKPAVLILDSLQVTTTSRDCDGNEGSAAQAAAVINTLQPYCLRSGMVAWILNHMTKGGGDAAGAEVVGHLVDVCFFLDRVEDEDAPSGLRILHAPEKNRTASTDHVCYFTMGEDGYFAPVDYRRRSRRLVTA
jgi:predicted ATP-dependent serine protease